MQQQKLLNHFKNSSDDLSYVVNPKETQFHFHEEQYTIKEHSDDRYDMKNIYCLMASSSSSNNNSSSSSSRINSSSYSSNMDEIDETSSCRMINIYNMQNPLYPSYFVNRFTGYKEFNGSCSVSYKFKSKLVANR